MKNGLKWIIGASLGAFAGYLYWYFIGCTGGSCPITSSPVNSTLYGTAMGVLLVNSFPAARRQKDKTAGNND